MSTPVLDTAPQSQYRIIFDDYAQAHFIVDEHMDGARCCLPDKEGNLKPLRFRSGRLAREWLRAMTKEGASD